MDYIFISCNNGLIHGFVQHECNVSNNLIAMWVEWIKLLKSLWENVSNSLFILYNKQQQNIIERVYY